MEGSEPFGEAGGGVAFGIDGNGDELDGGVRGGKGEIDAVEEAGEEGAGGGAVGEDELEGGAAAGQELAEGYGGAILTMGGEVWEEDGGDGAEVVIVFGAGEGGEHEG